MTCSLIMKGDLLFSDAILFFGKSGEEVLYSEISWLALRCSLYVYKEMLMRGVSLCVLFS